MQIKGYSFWFCCFLLGFLFYILLNTNKITAQTNDFSQDITYDTVIVYDTVWEYDTIFNTVTVFDTIYIDTTEEKYIPINPINATLVLYSPFKTDYINQLFDSDYKPNSNDRTQHEKTKGNKSGKRKAPRQKIKFTFQEPKLTLNPTKGKFNPHLFKMGKYSIEPYAGINFQKINTEILSANSLINYNEIEIKKLPGLDYGVKFNFDLYEYGINTGIGISTLRNNLLYTNKSYLKDSTENSIPVTRNFTFTDTVKYLDTDHLIKGDSVWRTHYYTYDTIITFDSLYYTYDSTLVKKRKSEIQTHTLAEIPLIFSYKANTNKTALLIKFGAINQFHLYSTGKTFSHSKNLVDINQTTSFTKYNLALYGGFSIVHQLSKKLYLGVDAFYKYPLWRFSNSMHHSTQRQTHGFHFSIKYQI